MNSWVIYYSINNQPRVLRIKSGMNWGWEQVMDRVLRLTNEGHEVTRVERIKLVL